MGNRRRCTLVAATAAVAALGLLITIYPVPRSLKDLLQWAKRILARYRPIKEGEESEQYPSDSYGEPEVRPIRTVAGLLSWSAPQDPNSVQTKEQPVSREQLFCAPPIGSHVGESGGCLCAKDEGEQSAGPKLLVCHDMKGGYQDDRWIQGSSNADAFSHWRWECVDVFVYFSHHMVTIPPPAWIQAAHRHHTKVLGTFITEWAAGQVCCEQLFATPASAEQAAGQLAKIAAYHGFDGWLVNIENGLSSTAIDNLRHFLRCLRAELKATCGPHAELIWYDAVTIAGQLKWQNHVTPLNQPFFDDCDAIYLNYAWQASTPSEVVQRVGSRACDVYLGVDVWGRGTYAGGQNNAHIAVDAAFQAGVSAALFAPGWLYEAFPLEGIQQRTNIWWDSIAGVWPCRIPPTISSFTTNFCCGFGTSGYYINGEQVSSSPWSNPTAQQLQPTPRFFVLLTQQPPEQSNAQAESETHGITHSSPNHVHGLPLTRELLSSSAGGLETTAPNQCCTTSSQIPESQKPIDQIENNHGVQQYRHQPHSLSDISSATAAITGNVSYMGGSCLELTIPLSLAKSGSPVACKLFDVYIPMGADGVVISLAYAQPGSCSSAPATAAGDECMIVPVLWVVGRTDNSKPSPPSLEMSDVSIVKDLSGNALQLEAALQLSSSTVHGEDAVGQVLLCDLESGGYVPLHCPQADLHRGSQPDGSITHSKHSQGAVAGKLEDKAKQSTSTVNTVLPAAKDNNSTTWNASSFTISNSQVPAGCVIVGLGVACLPKGKVLDATACQRTENGVTAARAEECSTWLLGHLSVRQGTDQENVQWNSKIALDNVLCRRPDANSEPSLNSLLSKQHEQQVSQHTSDPQAPPQSCIGSWSAAAAATVACDLSWDMCTSSTGDPVHSAYHVFARLVSVPFDMHRRGTISGTNASQHPVSRIDAGRDAVGLPDAWLCATRMTERTAALRQANNESSAPIKHLPSDGGWAWLGVAHINRFHTCVAVETTSLRHNSLPPQSLPVLPLEGLIATQTAGLLLPESWFDNDSNVTAVLDAAGDPRAVRNEAYRIGIQWVVKAVGRAEQLLIDRCVMERS